ncbi:MAG: YdcF family protein [Cyanobacteria bacterium P01_C01_bin.89]
MLFESLTFLLLWIFIGWLIWYLLFKVKFVPVAYYTGLGIITVAALLTIAFMSPTGRTSEILGSLLSLLFTPLGLALLLLSRFNLKSGLAKFAGNGFAAAAFSILLFSSVPVVGFSLAEQLERSAIRDLNTDQVTQAIVLLGDGTTRVAGIGDQRIELTESGDRITEAAQLYRRGVAPRIIVSAGFRPERNAYWLSGRSGCVDGEVEAFRECRQGESTDIRALLERTGVPANAISVPEGEIVNRREIVDIRTSALDVQEEFGGNVEGVRITLVTSAINMRRAVLSFESLGFTVVPAPTDFYTLPYDAPDIPPAPLRYLGIPGLIPSVEGLSVSTKVVSEYLLSVFYFLRGWISPFRM